MNTIFLEPEETDCPADEFVKPGKTDIKVQLVISLGLGITAFLAFCVSRIPSKAPRPTANMALLTDTEAAMEVLICRKEEALRSPTLAPGPPRLLLGMDPRAV